MPTPNSHIHTHIIYTHTYTDPGTKTYRHVPIAFHLAAHARNAGRFFRRRGLEERAWEEGAIIGGGSCCCRGDNAQPILGRGRVVDMEGCTLSISEHCGRGAGRGIMLCDMWWVRGNGRRGRSRGGVCVCLWRVVRSRGCRGLLLL